MTEAALLLCSFLLGSIPIGYLVAKFRGIDIRKEGSGNIGATNVLRVLGKGPGMAVFAADICKGLFPAIAGQQLMGSKEWAFAAGMAAVFGHTFSPFLGFKGGKGIATGLGMLLGSSISVGLATFGIFFLALAVSLTVSTSSVIGGLSLPILGYLVRDPLGAKAFYGLMALVVVVRHIPNLKRTFAGTEPVFGQAPGSPRPEKTMRTRVVSFLLGVVLVGIAAYLALRPAGV